MRQFNRFKGLINKHNRVIRFRYMITEEAKRKAKILTFWQKHGLEATMEAFGTKRPTLFLWKKNLREGGGKLEALNPKSKAPNKKRERTVEQKDIDFILKQRLEHPRLSKKKIVVLLNNKISDSTVGRVIKDLKEKHLIPSGKKFSMYAKTGNLIEREKPKKQKKLRRKGYQPKKAGDLVEIDTIITFIDGIRRYTVTAVDLYGRFAFAFNYSHLSSAIAKDFFLKLEAVAPFKITHVQTDNGYEFEKYFRDYLSKRKVIHFNTYPRQPKMNCHIERFNRTIQEEFLNFNKSLLRDDIPAFNRKMIEWLIWYNTVRPHFGIGLLSPMQFIISELNVRKSNMLWTNTST